MHQYVCSKHVLYHSDSVEFERTYLWGLLVGIFLSHYPCGSICFVQHVDLSVVLAIAFFSQEKRWNRPDVLHCSWPLYFQCTVAALKIVLARGSCDIFPTQRFAFDRSSLLSFDDRSYFLSLLEVFRSTFSSSLTLT